MSKFETFLQWKRMHHIAYLSQSVAYKATKDEHDTFVRDIEKLSCEEIEVAFGVDSDFEEHIKKLNKQRPVE